MLVTENRAVENGVRNGDIVISGTPDRLVRHLIEDRSAIDMTYDEVRGGFRSCISPPVCFVHFTVGMTQWLECALSLGSRFHLLLRTGLSADSLFC